MHLFLGAQGGNSFPVSLRHSQVKRSKAFRSITKDVKEPSNEDISGSEDEELMLKIADSVDSPGKDEKLSKASTSSSHTEAGNKSKKTENNLGKNSVFFEFRDYEFYYRIVLYCIYSGLDLTAKSFKCHGLDPNKLGQLAAYQHLPDISRKKYTMTWARFVQMKKIEISKPPTEADLYDFLKRKFDAGMKSSTIRSTYSHLNLACSELYKEKLNIYPSLYRLINSEAKKGPSTKKARPFEPEEFNEFFNRVDKKDCYQLVRAALAVGGYFGATRIAELKEVKVKGNII